MISQTPVFYLRCRHKTLSAAHLANHKSDSIRNYIVMWRTSDRQQSSSLHLAWPCESEREDKLKRMKCCASMLFCELLSFHWQLCMFFTLFSFICKTGHKTCTEENTNMTKFYPCFPMYMCIDTFTICLVKCTLRLFTYTTYFGKSRSDGSVWSHYIVGWAENQQKSM